MRSTFKVLFFLKRDKQKTNGMIPLYCRITVDGQEARFGMKCDVNPQYWDVKTNKAAGRTLEATKINTLIDTTKAAIYKVYREMLERYNYVTAEKIKNVFLGIEQKHQTLLELFDYHNQERKIQIGVNLCKSTYERYCITRQRIADFLIYKYNLSDIPIKEVNKQFISDFEIYLFTQYDFSQNNVVTLLKKFRHVIELALNREWIFRNPFNEYKLQWQKTDRGYLTQSEIETLINCKFENRRLEQARDIFIFCTFTGLAYTDVKHLTYSNIQLSFDGKLWIKGKRIKTDIEYNIPLLNIPLMIMEKYQEKTSDDLVLPICNIQTYNKQLKEIAKKCHISKNISSHVARHTFATLTLTQGVSLESVSKMLGHTSISTTQIYARITDKKVGNEMNVFAGNVKQLDNKMELTVKQTDYQIYDLLKSLKIRTDRASDIVWENLIEKVWNRIENNKRQVFFTTIELISEKPKTMHDFYIILMDYFLDNVFSQSDNDTLIENTFIKTKDNFAVNF